MSVAIGVMVSPVGGARRSGSGAVTLAAPAIAYDPELHVWTFTWQALPVGVTNVRKEVSTNGGENYTILTGVNADLVSTKVFDPQGATDLKWRFTAFDAGSVQLAPARIVDFLIDIPPDFTVQPTISPAAPLAGTMVTVTFGTATGRPAPTLTGSLTLDGVDVSGAMSGLTYTVPIDGGGKALVWTVTASSQAGQDQAMAMETVATPMVEPIVTVTADGGIDIEFEPAPGATHMQVEFTAPAVYAGTDTVAFSGLATGPVNLAPPSFTGTTTTGSTITPLNGLWLSEGGGLVVLRELVRGASTVVASNFDQYVIQASDVLEGLKLVEAASDANGTAAPVTTEVLPVPVMPSMTIAQSSRLTVPSGRVSTSRSVVAAGRFFRPTGGSADTKFVSMPWTGSVQAALSANTSGTEVRGQIETAGAFSTAFGPIAPSNGWLSFVIGIDADRGYPSSTYFRGWGNGTERLLSVSNNHVPIDIPWTNGFRLLETASGNVFTLEGWLAVWFNWTVADMATLTGLLFDSANGYEMKPPGAAGAWASNGAVTVDGLTRAPAIFMPMSAANFNAGSNAGTAGTGFTVTGSAS